jgi:hypothetical protein
MIRTDTVDPHLPTTRGDALVRTMALLLVWFFVALWLGLSGALRGTGGPPLALGAAIGCRSSSFGSTAGVGICSSRASRAWTRRRSPCSRRFA